MGRFDAFTRPMARYYFELRDGVEIHDEEGQEFPTLAEAREEAVKSARSMLREEILHGTLSLKDSICILDEARREIDIVYFRDVVRIED